MALREVRRVLKPDGRLLFLEHGRSDDLAIAKWQDRLNPFQNWFGCGCNLNRRIDQLIREVRPELEYVDRYVLSGSPENRWRNVPRTALRQADGPTALRHDSPVSARRNLLRPQSI